MWPFTAFLAAPFKISTHTSRVGCDHRQNYMQLIPKHFYSHIPCGMWRHFPPWVQARPNFYSHIPCGMWREKKLTHLRLVDISTHTSRVGCDELVPREGEKYIISTHTSRVGCDLVQSHPLRISGISTHTSRVGCDLFADLVENVTHISTHTSRVGCDSSSTSKIGGAFNFYSHIPCGMWLAAFELQTVEEYISTHTSRVGCDNLLTTIASGMTHFYSHIPCGMWLLSQHQ